MTFRRRALITGAAGGMGRACARLLGTSHELVLTDLAAPALHGFADELRAEGFAVADACAGPIGDAALVARLVSALDGEDPFVLVHTAAVSPSQADWRTILEVDLVATVRLLDSIGQVLRPGSAAVLIASLAGHMAVQDAEAAALCAAPLEPGFLDAMEPVLLRGAGGSPAGMSGPAYSFAKQAMLALAEQRAAAWGARGARIVTVSPGVIATPMGRLEMASHPKAAEMAGSVPAGRPGSAMEIAEAVRFLASDAAGFITGCDLRVDGGAVAMVRQQGA